MIIPDHGSLVIRLVGKDLECPVGLFQNQHPREPVGKGHGGQRKRGIGTLHDGGGESHRTADHEDDRALSAVLKGKDIIGELLGGIDAAPDCERDDIVAGLDSGKKRDQD